jgi:NOL1/NOP2/fmu family ribosome biogenesis protein
MEERFGIPASLFRDFVFLRRKNTWRILRKSEHFGKAGPLKVEAAGIRGFHRIGRFIKPSTRLIQVFGAHAVRSRLELDAEQIRLLGNGGEIEADPGIGNGYVVLCHRGHPLGLGLLIGGMVRSQVPGRELRFSMRGVSPQDL